MVTGDKSPACLALGRIYATPGALQAIADSDQTPADFLARHMLRDWGCVSPADAGLNDEALDSGGRVLSAYDTHAGTRLWIITEAVDESGYRAATTILLPEEY